MANFPRTTDWTTFLAETKYTTIEQATRGKPSKFTIEEGGTKTWNAYGTLGTLKVVAGTTTDYWWGFSTQVNTSKNIGNEQGLFF